MSQYFDVNDPLSAKTDWTPMKPGGANFTTHKLVEEGPQRLAMKVTVGVKILSGVLIVAGLVTMMVFEERIGQLLGLVVITAGVWIVTGRVFRFDGEARQFVGAEAVPFSAIHAVQVIKHDDEDSERYELNLVLTNALRIHVAAHSGREQAKQEAQRLGAFIGCKVWDTTAS